MTILKATLHKRWFDAIAQGIKTEEYREIKPYWTKRLAKEYDAIRFRNGYAANAPELIIEYQGFSEKVILNPMTGNVEKVYAIRLGRILEIKNYDGKKDLPSSKRKYEQVFRTNQTTKKAC